MGRAPPCITASQFMPYYTMAPKLNVGSTSQTLNLGSNAGTTAPVTGSGASQTVTGALTYKSDRLYASVDELAFESGLPNGLTPATLPGATGVTATSSYQRTTSNNGGVNNTIAGANSSAQQFLEKARFFLTASSRAPDVNLFNQPRIVCWPINRSSSTSFQTLYDQTIAWCGTINSNIFYFKRQRNDDPTNDLPATTGNGLNRNRNLIKYLQNETSQAVPGFGGDFVDKYDSSSATYAAGANKTQVERDQILTEIFDYIRCLNLMDPGLASATNEFAPAVGGISAANEPPSPFYPGYQSVWTSNPAKAWGGAGQVVPIIDTTANGGYTAPSGTTPGTGGTRGFGRFPTVEGATLLFICTGWNDGNHGNWTASDPNYNAPVSSKGDPAAWASGTISGSTVPANYPPGYAGYSAATPIPWPNYVYNGTNLVNTPTAIANGTGITPGCVRVQAILIVNMFDPSPMVTRRRMATTIFR